MNLFPVSNYFKIPGIRYTNHQFQTPFIYSNYSDYFVLLRGVEDTSLKSVSQSDQIDDYWEKSISNTYIQTLDGSNFYNVSELLELLLLLLFKWELAKNW